jgi:transcriptional regulator with XRE-family HTH domain
MSAGKPHAPGPLARAVSAEVRAAMARLRLSQMTVAEASEVSQNYLSKRLRDEMSFTLTDLERLSSVLRMAPEDLINKAVDSLSRDAVGGEAGTGSTVARNKTRAAKGRSFTG